MPSLRFSDDYDAFSVEVQCEEELINGIPTPTFDAVNWPTCKEGEFKKQVLIRKINFESFSM